jgi:hypothetical protein
VTATLHCKTKLFITAVIFHLIWSFAYSQSPVLLRSALGMGGASQTVSREGARISFPQSIGQSGITGVFKLKDLEVRQGFIQPVLIIKPSIEPEKRSIIVYPNPFSSVVFVNTQQDFPGQLELTVIDLAGKQVHREIFPANEIVRLDLSFLNRGLYILKIRRKDIQSSYKIIKY